MKPIKPYQIPLTLTILLVLRVVVNGDPENNILPNLDLKRVDELGWTDAHHVAYARPPYGDQNRRKLLQGAPEEYLCRQNAYGQTALHLAVRQDTRDVVELYVDRKLPCINSGNMHGDTPLHYAAAWGRLEATELLLHGGADATRLNQRHKSPFDDAKESGHERIAFLLKGELVGPHQQQREDNAFRKLLWSWLPPTMALLCTLAFEIRLLRINPARPN